MRSATGKVGFSKVAPQNSETYKHTSWCLICSTCSGEFWLESRIKSVRVQKFKNLSNIVDLLSEHSGRVVSYLIIPLTGIIVFEVVSRYGFHSPTIWALVLSQFIFGAYVVLGGAYGILYGVHVSIDVLSDRLFRGSPRARTVYSLVLSCLSLLFIGILMVWSTKVCWAATLGDRRILESWGIPLWPYMWTLPLSCLLMLLQEAVVFARNLTSVIGKRG